MCCSSPRRSPTPYMSAKKRKEQVVRGRFAVHLSCARLSPGKWRHLCCVCSEKIDPLRWRVPLSQIEARRHLPEGCREIMRSQGTKSNGRSTCGKTAVDKLLTVGLVLNHVAKCNCQQRCKRGSRWFPDRRPVCAQLSTYLGRKLLVTCMKKYLKKGQPWSKINRSSFLVGQFLRFPGMKDYSV